MTDNRPARCHIRLFHFSLAVYLLGLLSVESLFSPWRDNRMFDQWQVLPCRIQISELHPWGALKDEKFVPSVRFSYSMEGDVYQGNQFAWSDNIKPGSKKKVKAMLLPYPEGSDAHCFVDPEQPGRAYLKRPKSTGWLPIWLGALAFLGFLYCLVSLVKEIRRKPLKS